MAKNLVTAGGYHDTREVAWVKEVTQDGQTFAALANSGEARFHSLDLRLSTALTLIIRNAPNARALHDDLLVKEEQAQAAGTILRGRQILFLMYESFKTNTHMALLYNVTDLSALKYPGDSQLHHFRHQWDLITESMTDSIGQDTLATVLLTKIDTSNELRDDIAYYHRCPTGHADHSYRFLKESIDRCIDRKQQKKNRADQAAGFSRLLNHDSRQTATPVAPAMPTTGRGQGQKGRGHGTSRSVTPNPGGREARVADEVADVAAKPTASLASSTTNPGGATTTDAPSNTPGSPTPSVTSWYDPGRAVDPKLPLPTVKADPSRPHARDLTTARRDGEKGKRGRARASAAPVRAPTTAESSLPLAVVRTATSAASGT